MTPEQRVLAIRNAAIAFASDHGPLSAARSGDIVAEQAVARRLFECLKAEGLAIVPSPNAEQ
ncbi:hypothetical protein [Parvularcula sp. LCG005]|uniref:hypothetical protein n=1 Tax=Parvularcula sp. LCG005 TaxID=3078805 RepID=UPI002942AF96|nr:hypothetical protein [Parvularcula sp. LCG005]WOI54275.1 hypothetical protein RUI03_04565 [Parvularcula sp. LCG005]